MYLIVVSERQDYEDARIKLLNSVSGFRPRETIFEIGHKGSKGKTVAAEIMRARRDKILIKPRDAPAKDSKEEHENEGPEPSIIAKGSFRDPENYIAHFEPGNAPQERGYDVHRPSNSFAEVSRQATMNLAGAGGVSFAPPRP